MQIEIKKVSVESVYDLRHKVLRPGQPLASCYYPEDEQASAFHVVAIESEQIIAISSFYQESHPDLVANNAYRLRGMAVELELQGNGIGAKLLSQAIDICNKAGADLLWCNARVEAISFYQKLGFEVTSESFDIPGIGEHFLMSRSVK